MKRPKIVMVSTPREAMGWPCFYCGAPLERCKTTQGRCCGRCKSKRDPTAAH